MIVGVHPVHNPNIPSSAGILLAASKKFLYPRFYSGGKVPSAYNLTRIMSAGLPTMDPRPPAVNEHAIVYKNVIGPPFFLSSVSFMFKNIPNLDVVYVNCLIRAASRPLYIPFTPSFFKICLATPIGLYLVPGFSPERT